MKKNLIPNINLLLKFEVVTISLHTSCLDF